jgi:peptide deformylase
MKVLPRTQFGNPILRQKARQLSKEEILSEPIQELIQNMIYTLEHKQLGIGLAAPQVGKSITLAVVNIQKTALRTEVEPFQLVIINPVIREYLGDKNSLWEGCISTGSNGKCELVAQAIRHTKIRIEYTDESGKRHSKIFEGLPAHVMQHETDHLNGVLFVDRVEDTASYMTFKEYVKRVKKKTVK